MDLRRIRRLVAVLAAAALLGLALWGRVAASLEEPLFRLWWLINSIPQQWIWGILAILGFIAAFSLGRGQHQENPQPISPRPTSQTQLERLSQLIELADTSPWARDVLGRRLSETAAVLRALREGIHRDEALKEIRSGRWPAHPLLAAVLHPKREGEERNNQIYTDELVHALHALERYAQGGVFERN